METKLNFKSQICTTREQSVRLLALGLKRETADMFYAAIHNGIKTVGYRVSPIYNEYNFEIFTDDIPAWSLNRLIELKQPNTIDNAVIILSREQTYDKLIEMIAKSIKGGKFPKEYLEEKL